ncbi:hypothetical protein JXA88_13570, partial [Candidatus Fermentibacteria bacterium]|nr:hypothetical protein [Candidatus Fermentibacteria bacterium]
MSSNLARSALLVVVLVLVQNPGQSQATIYTVINTRDSGPGSLAQALWDAEGHAGFDSVYFNIPTSDSAYTPGPPSRWIIRPSASTLSLFDDVLIDGYTQPSAQPNTVASPGATDALLRIVLSGVNAGASANGLHLLGSSTVRGLVINSWSGAGIYLVGGPTVVEGNYIGTNANGVTAYGNAIGIDAPHGTHTIGGTTPAARNVISGNTTGGIQIGSAGLTAEITVQGNYIGTRASGITALANGSGTGYGISIDYGQNHLIGGTTAAARNLISGNNGDGIVLSQRSTGTIISGNYIGTHADGIADLGNTRHGVYLMYKTSPGGSTDAVIGGPSSGAGNVISGNDGCGVFAYGINDVVIQGNYVGINAAGSGALANSQDGIGLLLSDATSVGGTGSGEGNTISGNSWSGIRLRNSEYTLIRGNRIGTDVAGTADVGNGGHGVYVNSNHTEIGGSSSGYWNTIAFNDSCGVGIFWAYFNGVMGNSIHSNGRLGIDLAKSGDPASGWTYNDYQDPDFDSNYLQNYPVITSAKSNAALTVMEGTLNSTPSTTFYLQFYSNPTPDPTNYGEGTTWLRDTMVTTDGNGDAAFSVTYSPPLTLGSYVCATATDPDANTSEFGANREVSKLTLTVVNTNDAGTGSLRQALLYANASAGPDTILFDIPTSDPGYVVGPPSYWSIQPDSALPVLSDTVIIDGYSQPGAQPNTTPAPGASNAALKIELDGSSAGGSTTGLEVSAGGCVAQGLVINRYGSPGILINTPGGAHIRGCYIGTDVSGTSDLGNGTDGIVVMSGTNTLGGASPGDRNIISGNSNHGIWLVSATASNNSIKGNFIGVDVTGTSALGNANRGIWLFLDPSNNTIGGTGAGEANIIANSGNAGVGIHSATGNTIRGNSILDNAGLGIDLNDDGVSVNDSADVDTGPNNVQNHPVLSSAYPAGSTTRVQGALNSTPSTAFTLDFYASAAADPTGYGEGATWVGTAGVTTDVNGDVSFTTTISTAVAIGWYIAATATDPGGNTSEFSQCVMVTDPFVVITTSDSGPGSLREAITMANSIAGMDTITFDIPTSDPGYVAGPPAYWSIAPASNLPTINQGVMIDGYTQLGAQLNTVAAPDTSNAVLTVELRGNGGATGRGIQLNNVSNCVIRGLVINRFPGNGIFINGTGAGHLIEGNYIGTDITGTLDRGNTTTGIRIEGGQSNNIIGGTTPGSRNVISGNNTDGIFL